MNNDANEILNKSLKTIYEISNRPSIFCGEASFELFEVFVSGYMYAIDDLLKIKVSSRWQDYIEMKFFICKTDWSWNRILEYKFGEKEAIKQFYSLYAEYINDKIAFLSDEEFRKLYHDTADANRLLWNKDIP